ncbi:hypothetical protein BGZ51_002477, partial [Haplosporangium sp. Z 767]
MDAHNTTDSVDNQPATNWLEFFEAGSFASYQRATANAAWLANVQGHEQQLREWKETKNVEERFWKDLKQKEYVE